MSYAAVTADSSYGIFTNLKTHRWTIENIILDSEDYASNGIVPVSFDVIDGSNLVGHLGTLNILTVKAPLLKHGVTSTLSTEILVAHEADARSRMNNLLCSNFEAISLLLGLGAVGSWTNTNATSEIKEGIIASLAKTNKTSDRAAYQSRSRLTWKLLNVVSSAKPWIGPEDLARLLDSVYLNMVSHEDISQLMVRIRLEEMEKVSSPHYTRAAFSAMVRMVRSTINSDRDTAMKGPYAGLINVDQMALNKNYLQELLLWLHVTGSYATPSMEPAPPNGVEYGKWPDVEAVYVTVQIPRAALGFFTSIPLERRGIPCLCCTIQLPAATSSEKAPCKGATSWTRKLALGERLQPGDSKCPVVQSGSR